MFKVVLENYKNDYDKYYEEKTFSSLDDLGAYLKRENGKRDDTPRYSRYWKNPVGTLLGGTNCAEKRGYFRTGRMPNTYSLWLKKVMYNDIIVFEENNYCSPKFYDYLKELKAQFEETPSYGDF